MADQHTMKIAPSQIRRAYWPAVAAYGVVVVAALMLLSLPGRLDYVGADNDDVMRLVEVRNFLAGQGWFDLMEPRLGLGEGTLMHWSRLIDLPIAGLISLFGLFLAPERAEAIALAVWPLALAIPTLAMMGLAGRRIGGAVAMHIAFGLTALLLLTSNRFLPGAIDHHNVQLLLVATIAAMLVDPSHRPASFAVVGLASALALAIGAETTPLIAVACLVISALWAWHGARLARATAAFALTLTIAVTAAFLLGVPPARYAEVTCDSLSLGYYAIASVGGAAMFLSSVLASSQSRAVRFGLLLATGAAVLATAVVLAPECLGNPLSNLDPMLKAMWLDGVTEAKSFRAQMEVEPGVIGGFYATGLFAVFVCVFRIRAGDRVELHAILLPLILVSWLIGLIQIRGTFFANLLAVLPLALLIAQLRRNSNRDPEHMGAGFIFILSTLMAVSSVWAVVGVLLTEGTAGLTGRLVAGPAAAQTQSNNCTSKAAFQQLAGLEPGTVAAPSDSGVGILRFTEHRVLSAPYHRNQGGMLTELHIGLSPPDEAAAFLRGANVAWVALCPTNPQTLHVMAISPGGLYAQLKEGKVPDYLEALPKPADSGLQVYRVRMDKLGK